MIRAALTFDVEHPDRPFDAGVTERLLGVLAEAAIRATFFMQGRWAEAWPGLARAVAEREHLIGNHSHYHARMSLLTEAGIADDVTRAETAIEEATGVSPRPWFRCPFGDGVAERRVRVGLTAAGYRHVGWHVDGRDWTDGVTPAMLEQAVFEGIAGAGDGAVVLLHAWPSVTPAAVDQILKGAAARGIGFVAIDELGRPPIEAVPW